MWIIGLGIGIVWMVWSCLYVSAREDERFMRLYREKGLKENGKSK